MKDKETPKTKDGSAPVELDTCGPGQIPMRDTPDARHENSAGKELCGMCGALTTAAVSGKQVWACTSLVLPYICPAPGGKCDGFIQKPRKTKPVQVKPPRLAIPKGVRFLYFGRPRGEERHRGVMTVAYRILEKESVVEIGVAFCNTGDLKKGIKPDIFSKGGGRRESLKRLQDTPIVAAYLYSPRRTAIEIAQAILLHEFDKLYQFAHVHPIRQMVPGWTRDLAKRLKERRGYRRVVTDGPLGRVIRFYPAPLSIPIMLYMLADIAGLEERTRL